MYQEQINSLCKDLRLSLILTEYEGIKAECNEEFLYKLLLQLKEKRHVSRMNRRISTAGFDVAKLISSFDFSDITLPSALSVESLTSCEPFKAKENLILYGRSGTGKSHLATALGMEAIACGMKVLFCKTSRLVNELKEGYDSNQGHRFWKKLDKADVLILDEWGYIPFERTGTQLLFEAISSCYEKKSVVITTNLPFDEWNTIFYDEKLTTAILDRLVHHGHLILHDGPSYRIKHSLMQ